MARAYLVAVLVLAVCAGWGAFQSSLAGSARMQAVGQAPAPEHGLYSAPGDERSEEAAKQKLEMIFDKLAGGDIAPCREIKDPYPEFNGIAVDPANNIVAMSDDNLKSLLLYDRRAGSADSPEITRPLAQIKGANTYISAAAGVALDPVRREVYTAENDVGDDIAAFPYTARANYLARALAVPHGAYGIGISQKRGEVAVSVQNVSEIVVYRLGARDAELPLREIRGMHTALADPHGLFWDDQHDELVVANHGNWSRGYWDVDYTGGGQYRPPSIEVLAADAKGDAAPRRVIQGPKTGLDWPFGVSVDPVHDEIAVANAGTHSVLIFGRTAQGDVAPVRVLAAGPLSGITTPMGVAFDPLHDELWVANLGHTALVFDRTANGDAPPKRIIRNAPAGTAVADIGIPMSVAYDSKRDELLVPN